MPITPELLAALRYDAMLPVDNVRLVDEPTVKAHACPASMAHLEKWMRFDFRVGQPSRGKPVASGWKVHFSVAPDSVPAAWDAILPLVAKGGLAAKVAGPALLEKLGDPDERQAGKTIVVYADGSRFGDRPDFWKRFLLLAEAALRGARVAPGWAIRGDRPVPGSAYAAIRCDADPDGRYVKDIESFDPFGFPGPFDGIAVPRMNQAVPTGIADSDRRIERMLDFIEPGWETTDAGHCVLADDDGSAALIAKAMQAFEFPVEVEGSVVRLERMPEAHVARSWHGIMEMKRAAEIGDGIRCRYRPEDVRLSIGVRRSFAEPPEIRLAFRHAPTASRLGGALSNVFQRPAIRVHEGTVIIPYAGRLHLADGLRERYMARFREILDKAAEDPEPEPEASMLACR